jgi:hypothetical protein
VTLAFSGAEELCIVYYLYVCVHRNKTKTELKRRSVEYRCVEYIYICLHRKNIRKASLTRALRQKSDLSKESFGRIRKTDRANTAPAQKE